MDRAGDQELPPLSLVLESLEAAHEIAPDAVEPLLELGHFAYAVTDEDDS